MKKSPRREAIFEKHFTENSHGIRVLCPTRWTVRVNALESIISKYNTLHELWQESLLIVRDTEMKCRIQGVASAMHNLSKTLQSKKMSAAEGQKIAEMTICTLQSRRYDTNFELFWKKVTDLAEELDVDDPVLPRQRKRPRRYESGTSEGSFPQTIQDLHRITYYEALDLIISSIKSHFDQPGYKTYSKLEDLLKAAKKR